MMHLLLRKPTEKPAQRNVGERRLDPSLFNREAVDERADEGTQEGEETRVCSKQDIGIDEVVAIYIEKQRQRRSVGTHPSARVPRVGLRFTLETGVEQGLLGRQLASASRWDEATSRFSQAARLDPDMRHVYLEMLAQIFMETERYMLAIRTASQSLEVNPSYIYGRWTRARALKEFGELELANEEYQQLITDSELVCSLSEQIQIKEEEQAVGQLVSTLGGMGHGDALAVRSKVFNNRWFGDILFYESCDRVLHELIPTWRQGKVTCCPYDAS